MKLFAGIALLLLTAAAPRQVELRKGDTQEDVARRKERERAVSALGAARKAIAQLDAGTAAEGARTRLADAENLLAQAKYHEAATAADEAWKLASDIEREGTTFTVEVDDSGGTQVTSRTGQPVRVEAQGVQRMVDPGATVKIARGDKPSEPKFAPETPTLSAPKDRVQLKLPPDPKGQLGPVRLSWKASRGATSYVVEVLPVAEGQQPLVVKTDAPTVLLPALSRGKYWWKVKAVGDAELVSRASDARMFELAEEQLKLEVRGTDWK